MDTVNGLHSRRQWNITHLMWLMIACLVSACSGGGVLPSNSSQSGGGSGSSSGGGSSVTQSPYLLYASNYVAYSTQTNGAYLHSAQGGDVYTGFSGASGNNGSSFNYGCYSSGQVDMDNQQVYVLQALANGIYNGNSNSCSVPGSGSAPISSSDYAYISIKSPGSGNTSPVPPLDISQAGKLLIQMGNTYNPAYNSNKVGGNAKVFTVELSDATDANPAHATNDCSVNVTLGGAGANIFTPLGVANYTIPLTASAGWTCTGTGSGSLSGLLATGVTSIGVKIVGNNNPTMVFGEFDTIAVGYIGFTK